MCGFDLVGFVGAVRAAYRGADRTDKRMLRWSSEVENTEYGKRYFI
jgi:hypothetical protein